MTILQFFERKMDLFTKKWRKYLFGGCLLFGLYLFRIGLNKIESYIYKYPPHLHYELPIFGSFFTMLYYGGNFNKKILPKYGDIVKYNIFGLKFYKINDIELIHKIYKKVNGRTELIAKQMESLGFVPVLASLQDTPEWEFRRKTINRHFSKQLTKCVSII